MIRQELAAVSRSYENRAQGRRAGAFSKIRVQFAGSRTADPFSW